MTLPDKLRGLLQAVAQGQVSPGQAFEHLKYLDFEPVAEFAKVDHHRSLAHGLSRSGVGTG
nr:hypothetical protein [Halomicronema hongdechloris]